MSAGHPQGGPLPPRERETGGIEPASESSAAIVRLPEPGESAEISVPDLPPPPDYGSSESDPSAVVAPSSSEPPEASEAPRVGPDEEALPGGGFPEPPPLAVVAGEDVRAPVAFAPGSEHDVLFGELARLQRFLTEEQLEEALRISERLRREGRPKKLGKIMVKLGFLTATQAKYLLRLQRTPDPIEGYKLLERRGQGGMGVVYRAVQKSLKREVAIKILAPKWAQHARFLQRFFREAKLAAELKHPNVVGAIDVGESNGLHYYAMEYVDGWSVAEMLKEDGVFDEAEALDIALQVAKALEHAAEHHIVHRDVKPENILVTPDGVAKLADLGLSKQLTSDCSLTTEGKTLGTPFYVSPELARGQRDIDVRSDIYSLGATLYHMLAGEPPFVGDNPAAIMARHIAEEAVPLKRRRRDISLATSRLIEKMMAKDPARRYATAADLIEDIIAIRKGKNPFAAVPREPAEAGGARAAAPVARSRRGVVSPPERPGYGACFGRRVRASAAAIGAGALAVVAVLGIAYSYRSGRAPAPPPDPRAAFGPSAPAAAPATPAPDSVREAAAQTRLATVREIVEMRLDQGRYDEATEAIEALERDVAGTAAEAPARELRERVRRESDRALELALRKARHDLGSGRPDLALEILRDSPASRKPELEAEKARLRAEAERALREEKPVR